MRTPFKGFEYKEQLLYIKHIQQANSKNLTGKDLKMRKTAILFIYVMIIILSSYEYLTAQIFQWIDDKGVVHFTDNSENVPVKFREKVLKRDLTVAPEQQNVPDNSGASQQPVTVSSGYTKDEQLWRARFMKLRSEINTLEQRLPVKREEKMEIHRRWVKFQKGSDRAAENVLASQIIKDEDRIKELNKLLDDLEMEAARNSVPLEWRK